MFFLQGTLLVDMEWHPDKLFSLFMLECRKRTTNCFQRPHEGSVDPDGAAANLPFRNRFSCDDPWRRLMLILKKMDFPSQELFFWAQQLYLGLRCEFGSSTVVLDLGQYSPMFWDYWGKVCRRLSLKPFVCIKASSQQNESVLLYEIFGSRSVK